MIGGFSISINFNMYLRPPVDGVSYIRFDTTAYKFDSTSLTWDQETL